MPNTTHRRTNLFALLLWVAALLLVAIGFILRQIGLSGYAAAYADSSTAVDALEYYSSVINSQYMAELGNGLVIAGSVAVVIALLFHALSALHRSDALVGAETDPALAEIAALLKDDEPDVDVYGAANEVSQNGEIDPAAPDATEARGERAAELVEEADADDAVAEGASENDTDAVDHAVVHDPSDSASLVSGEADDTVTEAAIDDVADDGERR